LLISFQIKDALTTIGGTCTPRRTSD